MSPTPNHNAEGMKLSEEKKHFEIMSFLSVQIWLFLNLHVRYNIGLQFRSSLV